MQLSPGSADRLCLINLRHTRKPCLPPRSETYARMMAQATGTEEPVIPVSRPFHAWARLPDELKCEVLSHNLTLDGRIDKRKHAQCLQSGLFPLLATRNRHLANIAQEVYYNNNVFELCIGCRMQTGDVKLGKGYSFPPEDRISGLWCPKPHTAAMIRHLHIVAMNCKVGIEKGLICASHSTSWMYLIDLPPRDYWVNGTKDNAPRANINPEWQERFVNLHTLGIEWRLERDIMPGCFLEDGIGDMLRACIEKSGIRLRAPKVEFTVRDTYNGGRFLWHYHPCEQDHTEVFQHLKDMIMGKKT